MVLRVERDEAATDDDPRSSITELRLERQCRQTTGERA